MHIYATINIKIHNEIHKEMNKLKNTVKIYQIFLKSGREQLVKKKKERRNIVNLNNISE